MAAGVGLTTRRPQHNPHTLGVGHPSPSSAEVSITTAARSAVQQCDMMAGPHVPLAQHNNNNSRHSQPTSNTQAMYCTSYGSSYGRENFTPCLGHRHGTDYAANPRPAVYYRTSLGYHDKPSLGLTTLDSLTSQTNYGPFVGADGAEVPVNLYERDKPRASGYLQITTVPKTASMCLQTEYSRSYAGHQPGGNVPQRLVIAGHRGQTGFTKGEDLELNTFQPPTANMGQRRRTGTSIMRTDYMPIRFLQGTEVLRCLPGSRETGFTRQTKALLADPSVPLLPLAQSRKNTPTMISIGKKGCSGFVLNEPINPTILKRPLDRSHFITHYWSKSEDWLNQGV